MIGRWDVVDPMSESYHAYSPYNYVLNDPIGKLDPNGMWVEMAGGYSTNNLDEIATFLGQSRSQQLTSEEDPPKKAGKNTINKPSTIIRKSSVSQLQEGDIKTNQFLNSGLGFLNFTPVGRAASFLRDVSPEDTEDAVTASLMIQSSIAGNRLSLPATKEVMNPKDIHFMQRSIKNKTGNYTVVGNAESLANGSLNPNTLRMNVWKDASGKVWTLDHRRLAAFKLAGLKEAPIQWGNPSGQMWKMTTTNGGTSIKLKLGGGNVKVVK